MTKLAGILLLCASLAGCEPWWMSDDLVQISGEFLVDGRCNVHTPRGSLAPRVTMGTMTHSVIYLATLPDDLLMHGLLCEGVRGDSDSVLDRRNLAIFFTMPKAVPLPPGRYFIAPDHEVKGGRIAVGLALWHPGYSLGTKGAGIGAFGGQIYLEGIEGTIELWSELGTDDRTKPRVKARFTAKARRVWSM